MCMFSIYNCSGYETKNFVLPNDIIKVLCRGLAITPFNIHNKTVEQQMLYIILPKMHISLLAVLDAFING